MRPNEGYNGRRKMANVIVRFFDDETLDEKREDDMDDDYGDIGGR